MSDSRLNSSPMMHSHDEGRSTLSEKIAIAHLAHELAHELNNPLQTLTNLLYLAQKQIEVQQQQLVLEEATVQLQRLSAVVRTMLALAHESNEERLHDAGKLLGPDAFLRFKKEYESALHLASIVESANDAIYSKKLDGTIMAWNRGAERLFGYSISEALGKSIRMLVPQGRMEEERRMMDRIRAGERVDHFETVRRTKERHEIRVSVSLSPIRNNSGRVVGVSTIAREIHN